MNVVEPIRDKNDVRRIGNYLRTKGEFGYRNYMMWLVGVYTGLRISDILPMTVEKFRDKKGNIRTQIEITEMKTSKRKFLPLPKPFINEIKKYVFGKQDYQLLFPSREKNSGDGEKALSRQQAYRIIKKACSEFGYEFVGCHTTRKTFGYNLYQDTKDIILVQEILNHSDPSITRRYIGLTEDMKAEAIRRIAY